MPLALSSAPAASWGTNTITCAAFTPPDNCVIIVFGWNFPNNATVPTISDSRGLTWTLQDSYTVGGIRTQRIWTTAITTSPGSMTVSVNPGGNVACYLSYQIWTGIDAASPLASVSHNQYAEPNVSVSATSTVANSRHGIFLHDSNNQDFTAAAGETRYGYYRFGGYLAAQFAEGVFVKDANNGAAGTSVTLGATCPYAYTCFIILFELKPRVFNPTQQLNETAAFTDTLTRWLARGFTEAAAVTDCVAKMPGKAAAEAVTITDALARWGEKLLTEVAAFIDAPLGRTRFLLLSEAGAFTDWIQRVAGKLLSESAGVAEAVRKDSARAFEESAAVTDLIELARSYFRAMATELVTVADTLARGPQKVITEAAAVTDSVARFVNRTLNEAAAVADTVAKRAQRIFSETAAMAEALVRMPLKQLLETTEITDWFSYARCYYRTVTDSFSLADTLAKARRRALQYLLVWRPGIK